MGRLTGLRPCFKATLYIFICPRRARGRFCSDRAQSPSTMKELDLSRLPIQPNILVTGGNFPHVGLRNAGFLF